MTATDTTFAPHEVAAEGPQQASTEITRALLLVAGVALLVAFVWHALRAKAPLIDLRLFRHPTFATSSMTLMLVGISLFGAFLLLPLYFQAVRGETPLMSGVLLVPQGVGSMISMPIAGQLSDRLPKNRPEIAQDASGHTAMAL
jgi:predicted MFS family arabinose efflux permease